MIELPYLTEERLHKMGIPMGPRIRILQEAQLSIRSDSMNDYGMV
jgi:Fe2+ transport system protein FeoA